MRTTYKILDNLLLVCYRRPPSTKSDYMRAHASLAAMAASLELITSYVPGEGFTSSWYLTAKGLEALSNSFNK